MLGDSHFGFVTIRYYLCPEYSDLTIICKDVILHAQKLVVCPQSRYFARACGGKFQESSGTIIIDEGNAIIMKPVLQFFYYGDYAVDLESFIPPYSEVVGDTLSDAKPEDQYPVDYTAAFHILIYFRDTFRYTARFGQSRAFTAAVVIVSKLILKGEEPRQRAIEIMVENLPGNTASIPYKALELLPDISQQLAICALYRHSYSGGDWSKHQ